MTAFLTMLAIGALIVLCVILAVSRQQPRRNALTSDELDEEQR